MSLKMIQSIARSLLCSCIPGARDAGDEHPEPVTSAPGTPGTPWSVPPTAHAFASRSPAAWLSDAAGLREEQPEPAGITRRAANFLPFGTRSPEAYPATTLTQRPPTIIMPSLPSSSQLGGVPWTKEMDMFICNLEAEGELDTKMMINKLKQTFPVLRHFTITEEAIERRIITLDNSDNDYFKAGAKKAVERAEANGYHIPPFNPDIYLPSGFQSSVDLPSPGLIEGGIRVVHDDSQPESAIRDVANGFESMILGSDQSDAKNRDQSGDRRELVTSSTAPATPTSRNVKKPAHANPADAIELETLSTPHSDPHASNESKQTPARSSSLQKSSGQLGSASNLPSHRPSRHRRSPHHVPITPSQASLSAYNSNIMSAAGPSDNSPSAGRRERRPPQLDMSRIPPPSLSGTTAVHGSNNQSENVAPISSKESNKSGKSGRSTTLGSMVAKMGRRGTSSS